MLPESIQRGNVWRLAVAQALAGANSIVIYAIGAIVGNELALAPMWATLPISIFVVGMAVCIVPLGLLARRYGRRTAFMIGTSSGMCTGLLALGAVWTGSFALFCVATFFGGIYAAVVQSFRFTAADSVPAAQKVRALSWVMAGGVLAGIIGPQLVTWSMDVWSGHRFAVTFLLQSAVAACSAWILWGVRRPQADHQTPPACRPIRTVLRQPKFIVAAASGAASYMVMNFLMTAAPLTMHLYGHTQAAANWGLQWHVVAMYLPSFFTGKLIQRWSAQRMTVLGLLLLAVAAAIGLHGRDVTHFWAFLVVLGVGWNFGFLGASALILECHRPEEKTQVQSANDLIIFGMMTVGSFASGSVLSSLGWASVLWISLLPLAAVLTAIAALNGYTALRKQ